MRRGFTLVEVGVAMGLAVILGLIVLPSLFSTSRQSDLTSTVSQINLRLADARTDAIDQNQGSTWGIHFSNPLNGTPSYSIFKGSSYATGTIVGTYPLPSDIGYVSSTLTPGSSRDVVFLASGAASASTTLTLDVTANTTMSSSIAINFAGGINSGIPIALGSVPTSTPSGPSTTTPYLYVSNYGGGAGYVVYYLSLANPPFAYSNIIGHFPCPSTICSPTGQSGYFGSPGGPGGVAINTNGTIYVVDEANNRVEEFDSNYNYITQLGCASGICATGSGNTQFDGPNAVAIDQRDNSVYIADSGNNRIVKYSSSGTFLYQLWCNSGACPTGSGRGGTHDDVNAEFLAPAGLFVDASGNLWVTESNNRIEEWSSNDTYLTSLFGSPSYGCPGLADPTDIVMDTSNTIYVVSSEGGCVLKTNTSGVMLSGFTCSSGLCSVAVDYTTNNVYISDPDNNTIQIYSHAGALLTTTSLTGSIGGMYVHYP